MTYNNLVTKRTKHPIYAGMSIRNGQFDYSPIRKVGVKIIETVYDVNPDWPQDAQIISEREVSRTLSA